MRNHEDPHKHDELITSDLHNLKMEAKATVGKFYPRLEETTGRKMTTSRRNTHLKKQ